MELAKLVNSVGLILDIGGALLLIFYNVPRDYDKVTRFVSEDSVIPSKEKVAGDRRWEKTGLVLLVVGFAGQLLSNLLPTRIP